MARTLFLWDFLPHRLSSKCTSIIVKLAKKKKQSVYGVGRMMWNAFSVISNKSIGS